MKRVRRFPVTAVSVLLFASFVVCFNTGVHEEPYEYGSIPYFTDNANERVPVSTVQIDGMTLSCDYAVRYRFNTLGLTRINTYSGTAYFKDGMKVVVLEDHPEHRYFYFPEGQWKKLRK